MAATTIGVGSILPLEVVDKMIGHKVWIIMTGNKEYFGFLRGFDEYLNVVLDEVKIYDDTGSGGRRILEAQIESLLLNGSHISMIVPGNDPPPKGQNE